MRHPQRPARHLDLELPGGWPAHPSPVDCRRCRGRVHQFALAAGPECGACRTSIELLLENLLRPAAC